MVAIFRRMGLKNNLDNNKSMVCTTGFIWGKWYEQAYKRQSMGEGETFKERMRMRVSFTKCGLNISALYLKQPMVWLHGICVPKTRGVNKGGGVPTTYVVSFPRVLQLVRFPMPGCPVVAHSAVKMW